MPSTPSRFRLLDDEQVLHEPDQEFLIDRVCSTKSLVLTHGQSGHGKSFVAIDAAFSVASGHDWHGYAIRSPGPVVYVAAEGQPGLKDRIRAWKQHHGLSNRVVGVRFILEAVDPLDQENIEALRAQLSMLPEKHKLVVVDTWSACMGAGEGDENATKDTSRAIFAWRRIIEDLGATVWIVHHSGHSNKDRARGSSALKAAAETEIAVAKEKSVVVVKNLKQRDGSLFDNLRLTLQAVQLGDNRDSCVLVPTDLFTPGTARRNRLSERAHIALTWLRHREAAGTGSGLTFSDWRGSTRQAEATFDRARSELVEVGYVEKSGDGKGALYHTTQKGRDYLHPQNTPTETLSESRPSLPPSTVTPRRGDGGGGEGSEDDAGAETKAGDSAAGAGTAP